METYSNLGDTEAETRPIDPEEDPEESRFTETEISDGMDGARFSYLFNFFGLPFCLIPLLKRENAFSLFHAKQAFVLWMLFFGSLIVGWAFLWVTLKAMWLFVLGGGASLALNVIGYQRVLDENEKPLPVVGSLAETWFESIVLLPDEEEIE
jgi:uncharacterized membrane protein